MAMGVAETEKWSEHDLSCLCCLVSSRMWLCSFAKLRLFMPPDGAHAENRKADQSVPQYVKRTCKSAKGLVRNSTNSEAYGAAKTVDGILAVALFDIESGDRSLKD
jgi:hypothetical protein